MLYHYWLGVGSVRETWGTFCNRGLYEDALVLISNTLDIQHKRYEQGLSDKCNIDKIVYMNAQDDGNPCTAANPWR